MIKVSCEVEIYESDGTETPVGDKPVMHVSSHWSDSGRVVLGIAGKQYTVLVKDICAAVSNAGTTAKY